MANYKKLVPLILKWEGGYVNDPLDKGGATNKGVTFKTWQAYCKKTGKVATIDTLKNISDEDWGLIFKEGYWDKVKADDIASQSVANILVDWVFNSGFKPIRTVQRHLGLKDDGIVGRLTISALNAKSPERLFNDIKKMRIDFVNNIVKRNPSQKKFLNGWMNRINSFSFAY